MKMAGLPKVTIFRQLGLFFLLKVKNGVQAAPGIKWRWRLWLLVTTENPGGTLEALCAIKKERQPC
jgi:hypothetical protein